MPVIKYHQLKSLQIKNINTPGLYTDGQGLYLQVTKTLSKSWLFRFRDPHTKKIRAMGLGPISQISLAEARELSRLAAQSVAAGKNPIIERQNARQEIQRAKTFKEFAQNCIDNWSVRWKNDKTTEKWQRLINNYAAEIAELAFADITTQHIVKCLSKIWTSKPTAAREAQQQLEKIFDAARVDGQYKGENPARWDTNLKYILSPKQKLSRGNHPALPHAEMPEFIYKLRQIETIAALALEFTILTAVRTGATINAVNSEFDFDEKIWTIPAKKMKSPRDHRVPLTPRVLEILQTVSNLSRDLGKLENDSYIFPGGAKGGNLSNMAMMMTLRRLLPTEKPPPNPKKKNKPRATVHGFRATFRTWGQEETEFPREILEAALAHKLGDEAEQAYKRGDALKRRRNVMLAWENFCNSYPKK